MTRTSAALKRAPRAAAVTFALAATALAGCATNPVTGERQLALITEGQEISMGQEAAQQIEPGIGLVDDAALQRYVEDVSMRMAQSSERPDIPWRFRVLDDPTPNAFALPGGPIYATRGLLAVLNSEAQLAAVMGHEIGHVTARHHVTQLSRAQLAQLGLGLGVIFMPGLEPFAQAAGAGLSLLFMSWGRDAERQSDDLGLRYMLGHNYDGREMVDVFIALARASHAAGQSPLPAWLSTHPYPEERIERIQQHLRELEAELQGTRIGREEYLTRIDGLVYGDNPRHGFFEDGLFLHPELRFRIGFPQGWTTQNLAQVVVAVSPRQDAAIQLTIAQGTPDQANRAFASQQGIRVAQSGRETIGGFPAVTSYFEAATQQGPIVGVVTFIAYDGRTYQILGYSGAQQFRAYEGAFRQTAQSFAELTDQRALSIQPDRLEIVRIPEAMTLAQFHQRYGSAVPLEELVLINGATEAGALMTAGTLVKRVAPGS